jgi:hypothetical protein
MATHEGGTPEASDWEEIHGFASPGEFERFRQWLREAIDEGGLTEVDVAERYSGSTIFHEQWLATPEGEIWRVVDPDFPFRGVFLRVSPHPADIAYQQDSQAPIISLSMMLRLAELVATYLADGDSDLLARLCRNRRFTGQQIRQRLRELRVFADIAKPPPVEDSGLEVLFNKNRTACWLVTPIWQRGARSAVAVELEVTHVDRSEWIVLQRIGPAAEPPTGYTRVAQTEIVEEIRRQDQAEREWVAAAKVRMNELRTAPPPVLPDGFRQFAQLILDGLVEARYEAVASLRGDGDGVSADDIARVVGELPGPLARPPQGLPPSTRCYEYTDGTGATVEFPLWTAEFETELVAVVIADRTGGAISGYLYDIKAT